MPEHALSLSDKITLRKNRSKLTQAPTPENLLKTLQLPLESSLLDHLYYELQAQINWQEDFFMAFERKFSIPRLQAWYADNNLQYRYADNLLETQEWLEPLLQLRHIVENISGHKFNSVLATQYRNGEDHVTWHADDEKELGESPYIVSLSLGASRTFQYRHKTLHKSSSLILNHGDCILMQPDFQKHWEHQVPVEPEVKESRINLTFRYVSEL